jgi:hypothetical protein
MMMTKSLLILIVLLVCAHTIRMEQRAHRLLDISQYVFGRIMIINPCYILLDDPTTTFKLAPLLLTITTPCSTHSCPYSLNSYDFTLGDCSQVATTPCSQEDPADDYIKSLGNTRELVLQANIVTLVDGKGKPTLQLKDIK